jgi:hypothetical protein
VAEKNPKIFFTARTVTAGSNFLTALKPHTSGLAFGHASVIEMGRNNSINGFLN